MGVLVGPRVVKEWFIHACEQAEGERGSWLSGPSSTAWGLRILAFLLCRSPNWFRGLPSQTGFLSLVVGLLELSAFHPTDPKGKKGSSLQILFRKPLGFSAWRHMQISKTVNSALLDHLNSSLMGTRTNSWFLPSLFPIVFFISVNPPFLYQNQRRSPPWFPLRHSPLLAYPDRLPCLPLCNHTSLLQFSQFAKLVCGLSACCVFLRAVTHPARV